MAVKELESFNQSKLQCATLNIIGDYNFPASDGISVNKPILIESTTSRQLKILYDSTHYANLTVNSSGNLYIDTSPGNVFLPDTATLTLDCTTDSTKIDEGSLVTSGGVGIAKNLYVGGIINTKLAADPSTGAEGDIYYNSATKKLRFYNGSIWADV